MIRSLQIFLWWARIFLIAPALIMLAVAATAYLIFGPKPSFITTIPAGMLQYFLLKRYFTWVMRK